MQRVGSSYGSGNLHSAAKAFERALASRSSGWVDALYRLGADGPNLGSPARTWLAYRLLGGHKVSCTLRVRRADRMYFRAVALC